jgi:hypothetical protein
MNTNGITGQTQTQPAGNGADMFSATQSISKGGMRGIGLVAAMLGEIILKNKAIDIARDYYNTNKRDYDFYFSRHSGPMAASITEAFGPTNPTYNPDLYASAASGIAKSAVIDRMWYEARRRIPKYNVGQAARLDYDMALARAAAAAAGWGISNRYELNWADERNDRAFKRKVEMANIGIGIANSVRDKMTRATTNLASAYDNIGDNIASIGNGYAAKKGYEAGRSYGRNKQSATSAQPTGMP